MARVCSLVGADGSTKSHTVEVPIVHFNGTDGEALRDQLRRACEALRDASAALSDAAPNERDYYPGKPGSYSTARLQYEERVGKIREVTASLLTILDGVEEQLDMREKRPAKVPMWKDS